MPARHSGCGYPNEYVSDMSTAQREHDDEVKGVREGRLRSDAIRAALRCDASAPGYPEVQGQGQKPLLRLPPFARGAKDGAPGKSATNAESTAKAFEADPSLRFGMTPKNQKPKTKNRIPRLLLLGKESGPVGDYG